MQRNAEAEAGVGQAAGSAPKAGGGLVPEQKGKVRSATPLRYSLEGILGIATANDHSIFSVFQDQAEADRGRLRAPQEVLRESDRGEPAAAQGGAGTEGAEALPSVLHADESPDHTHYVPIVRAGRGPRWCTRPEDCCHCTGSASQVHPHQPMGHGIPCTV